MTHLLTILILCTASMVQAEAIVGIWASPPDKQGQIGHVAVKSCDDGYCGTLTRAFDARGAPVVTPNVGRRLLWSLRAVGQGAYEGRAFVPAIGRDFPAQLRLQGDRLTVSGCMPGVMCKRQTWERVP